MFNYIINNILQWKMKLTTKMFDRNLYYNSLCYRNKRRTIHASAWTMWYLSVVLESAVKKRDQV